MTEKEEVLREIIRLLATLPDLEPQERERPLPKKNLVVLGKLLM